MAEILSDDECFAALEAGERDWKEGQMVRGQTVLPRDDINYCKARAVERAVLSRLEAGMAAATPAPSAEPSDEMVEAACEAYLRVWSACEQSGYVYSMSDIDDAARACMRAALRAALGVR